MNKPAYMRVVTVMKDRRALQYPMTKKSPIGTICGKDWLYIRANKKDSGRYRLPNTKVNKQAKS